ncbi:MAG: glycoside hydrolase family 92 protein [Verrucomicrobia bacterium]|nr:glycoside hydrolase family 92 protein [Verrucomicrobiota bacterium]MCH8512578.1 glycoside hydrolase family 92 protein [Kiritimatiellia bacterium]
MTPSPRTTLIDCFHGVDGHGSCLPGPYLPFSLVRVGPDTLNPNPNGYASGQPLLRFSHTHVSGTGGSGRYANIGVVPSPRRPGLNPFAFQILDETARPGYYRAELSPGPVIAELTSTPHAALHRYTFRGGPGPFGLDKPHIALETGAVLCGEALDGEAVWADPQTCEGLGTLRGGWGHDEPFTIYFSARFRQCPEHRNAIAGTDSFPEGGRARNITAIAGFPCNTTVELEVGISYVSVDQARAHRERELAGRSFQEVADAAASIWERQLAPLAADSADPAVEQLYHTMLYRFFCMPDDLGLEECPWFPNRRRQFNNLYCLWDSVRNANSFLALWEPEFQTDLCNALLEIADHTGWTPDAWIMGHRGAVQGGCSAFTLFTEARLKGLDGVDPREALDRMLHERNTPSPDPVRTGRHPGYAERGWLPDTVPQCLSRSLEYSFQEENLARLAESLGETDLAREARDLSRKILDLWNPDLKSFAPKTADGSPAPGFDPWKPQRLDFWSDPHTYEGTGHEWSLTCIHLMDDLIRLHGGPQGFVDHLDRVFEHGFFLWKEIILHVPWLYHFAGRPDLSARRVRQCLDTHYLPGRRGLIDNEDMGSQSSFALGALAGIYPLMGTDLYLLLPPVMDEVRWHVGPQGNLLTLRKDPALRGLLWNGKPYPHSWIRHQDLLQGGELITGPVETWQVSPPPFH